MPVSNPPKYTVYELLEMLVERTGWPSERIKLDLLDVVYRAREMNALGVLGVMLSCQHPEEAKVETSTGSYYARTIIVCDDCKRVMT